MTTRPLDGETEPKCCTGTPMAENIAEGGYCCAKPTDEELVEAQAAYGSGGNTGCCPHADAEAREAAKPLEEPWPCRETCERADIPMNVTFAEREQMLAGGSKRAVKADMIVRLHPDGTYHILKNRGSLAAPFTQQSCVIYVSGKSIVPFPSLSDQAKGQR